MHTDSDHTAGRTRGATLEIRVGILCKYAPSVLRDRFAHSPPSCCFSRGQGETCPEGYTCLCRPCEQLPEFEFSFSLQGLGEAVRTGECEHMVTCASGMLPFSNLTLFVVDNWGPGREVCLSERLKWPTNNKWTDIYLNFGR